MPSQRMLSGSSSDHTAEQARLLLPAESVHSSSSFQQRVEEEGNSMRQKKFWFGMSGIMAALAMALMLPTGAVAASKFHVLYRFPSENVGGIPNSVTLDAAGNLYGTAQLGGPSDRGIVFKLKPNSDGSWTESTLYAFCSLANCADGDTPGGPLVFDAAGNLYGTTQLGGDSSCQPPYGCGTVFKLKPNSGGSWTESVLHSFTRGADGFQPVVGVTFDTSGNLYGTTISGGPSDLGTVFKLKPNSDGSWTESVLYSFCSLAKCTDGSFPDGEVLLDKAGNLYGTASYGGDLTCSPPDGCGVVFKLKPNSDGSWTDSVLHRFKDTPDGRYPSGDLSFDQAGNLYGTASSGGDLTCMPPYGCGVVFKLKPNSDGSWTESVLHRFANHPAATPFAGLTFDASGNLYGSTFWGGDLTCNAPYGCGVVFKLKPNSDGSWALHIPHIFLGKPAVHPLSSLVLDKAGNLYGTTECGRVPRCSGVVFEITP
jgi:uncharacterized repeat protein (TIGR03803 family)